MKKYFMTSAIILVLGGGVSSCSQDPVGVQAYGVQKGAGSTGIHTILAGDTVYKVAQNYQLPMRDIITMNNIRAPYALKVGDRLRLPPPNEYRVREGDSVSSVSRLYELSPSQLVRLNNLPHPFTLKAGQVVRLPTLSNQESKVERAINKGIKKAEDVINDKIDKEVLLPKETVNTAPDKDVVAKAPVATNKDIIPPRKPKVTKTSINRNNLPKETPKLSGKGSFMRPIDGKVISRYGPKKDGLHNDGINIKGVRGTPVRAAENGVVVYNGNDLAGYGNLVLIRHENKLMSAYAHLDKTLVKRGAKVKRGQSIGTVGSTGQVDTPQLHFEIRKGSTPLNPEKYL